MQAYYGSIVYKPDSLYRHYVCFLGAEKRMLQRAAAASWIKQKGQRTLLVEKVGNIKTRIKENLHYLPFILLGACTSVFSFPHRDKSW